MQLCPGENFSDIIHMYHDAQHWPTFKPMFDAFEKHWLALKDSAESEGRPMLMTTHVVVGTQEYGSLFELIVSFGYN